MPASTTSEAPRLPAAVAVAVLGLIALALIAYAPGADGLTSAGWGWPPLLIALIGWAVLHLVET